MFYGLELYSKAGYEVKSLNSKVPLATFMVLTVVFGAIAGYEYWGTTESTPTSTTTMTVTTTATVTSFGGSSTAEPRVFTNGTASVQFLSSSLVNGTTLSFGVKNVGNGPLSIAYLVVNNVPINFNGSGGLLVATQNPIPPNASATITINSASINCGACSHTYTVSLVTDKGLMLTDLIYFV